MKDKLNLHTRKDSRGSGVLARSFVEFNGDIREISVIPSNSDLDNYYGLFASMDDIIGDVDMFGYYTVWKDFEDKGSNFKFSDVLKHYYRNSPIDQNHFTNRWKTFAENFTPQLITSSNTWNVDKNNASSAYLEIKERLIIFSNFLYLGLTDAELSTIIFEGIVSHTPDVVEEFMSNAFLPFSMQELDGNVEYVLDKTLSIIKTHLNAEQGWSL
jgi:hypothetical protein